MPAKLYKFDLSPPARIAMMACEVFNVPVEMVDIDLMQKQQLKPEFLKINPLHTVPTLADGDIVLHDSHAIVAYLADAYGKNDSWFPKDAKKRALVTQKLFFNSSTLFSRLRNVTFYAFFHGETKVSAQKIADIEEAYTFLEGFLSKTKYIALDNITIADVACAPTVHALGFIVKLDDKKYPKTSAWLKDIEKQPFWKKYGEAGGVALGQAVTRILEF